MMNIEIFTQGSGTTTSAGDNARYIDYFSGSFMKVQNLREDLSSYGEVNVHILDDEIGYVTGDMRLGEGKTTEESAVTRFRETLLEKAETADVILIMLTKDLLEEVLVPNWNEISERAQPNSTWCLSCPRSVIDELNLDNLRDRATLFIYQRKGVARLGQDVEKELLEHLDGK
jgi:hypothetical protein